MSACMYTRPCCIQKKLHGLSVESQAMDQEIEQRRELQARVDAETTTVTKVRVSCITRINCVVSQQEKVKAEAVNAESRRKLEDYRVPDVSYCL